MNSLLDKKAYGLRGMQWLEPKFDGAKSFYKKACVVRCIDGSLRLDSYEAPVVIYSPRRKAIKFYATAWYSRTTKRHVKEFCLQLGVPDPFNKANRRDFKEML